jgi:biotin carboxyl carrier protein
MDIRKVKKLIELLDETGVAEIEIKEGEESVRISRHPSGATFAMMPQPRLPPPPLNGPRPRPRRTRQSPRRWSARSIPRPRPARRRSSTSARK